MARLKISFDKYPEYLRKLGKVGREAMQKGMLEGAQKCIPVLIDKAAEEGVFDTGNYRGKFRAYKTPNGVVVANEATYAGVIDLGRRRNKKPPPRDVIARWAMRKLGLSKKEADQAAFPIARAIGKKGIKGKKIMTGLRETLTKIVRAEAQKSVKEAYERALVK